MRRQLLDLVAAGGKDCIRWSWPLPLMSTIQRWPPSISCTML